MTTRQTTIEQTTIEQTTAATAVAGRRSTFATSLRASALVALLLPRPRSGRSEHRNLSECQEIRHG